MGQPRFSVLVSDVEQEDQHRSWEIPASWLSEALEGSEASPTDKTGRLTVSLMKHGSKFLVRGKVAVQVQLPCARTLDPAVYDLTTELFLMLTQENPDPGGPERRRSRRRANEAEEESELTDEDAASDSFVGEVIHLDEFVREQVLLELPMFPLRSDLRLERSAPIGAPPQASGAEPTLDPRLAPLKRIAEQIAQQRDQPEPLETATEPEASTTKK